jgi:hypothetical protein
MDTWDIALAWQAPNKRQIHRTTTPRDKIRFGFTGRKENPLWFEETRTYVKNNQSKYVRARYYRA